MKKYLIALCILGLGFDAYAQQIKVRRVKGRQAVVEFSGADLQTGQTYEIVPEGFTSSSSSEARRYLISLSFDLTSTKDDGPSSENITDIRLTTRFGWNLGNIEVGPLFTYSSEIRTAGNRTTLTIGGFADYNMIANTPGESFLYGAGGYASMGQNEMIGGAKSDLMTFFAGPFVKWFPTGSNYAFRVDGGFIYQKVSASSGDSTTSGLSTSVGMMAYF